MLPALFLQKERVGTVAATTRAAGVEDDPRRGEWQAVSVNATAEASPASSNGTSGWAAVVRKQAYRHCCRVGWRCFGTWIGILVVLCGLAFLIVYLVLLLTPLECGGSALGRDSGGVVIADGCTVMTRSNSSDRRRLRRLQEHDVDASGPAPAIRFSFADVGRSLGGSWRNPPLAYWTDFTTSNSPFANLLSPERVNETSSCVPQEPKEGCEYYYESIVDGKVVDIKTFANTSMRDIMRSKLYHFEEFYTEVGRNCASKVSAYNKSDFRKRFECAAKTYNDGNRFINPFAVDLVRNGDVGVFVIADGGPLCPEGLGFVRVFDVQFYPVVYIEMLAHLYNIFVDQAEESEAIETTYDYTPRSLNDLVAANELPCRSRTAVQAAVDALAG